MILLLVWLRNRLGIVIYHSLLLCNWLFKFRLFYNFWFQLSLKLVINIKFFKVTMNFCKTICFCRQIIVLLLQLSQLFLNSFHFLSVLSLLIRFFLLFFLLLIDFFSIYFIMKCFLFFMQKLIIFFITDCLFYHS